MPDRTETTEDRLRGALAQSIQALDDWLNLYAPDFCDEARVGEAKRRVGEAGGTLAYIAKVQQASREALK